MKKVTIACVAVILFISCKQPKTKLTIDVNTLQHQCVQRLTDVIVYDIFSPPVASRIDRKSVV